MTTSRRMKAPNWRVRSSRVVLRRTARVKARQAKVAEYLKVGLDNIFKWDDDLHWSS